MNALNVLKLSVGPLDADVAANLVAASADVAFVVDREGRIQDLFHGSPALADSVDLGWRGRPWIDTVANDSRRKVTELLDGVDQPGTGRWREVNQIGRGGAAVPLRFTTLRMGEDRVLAIGRDLSLVAALQQRVLDTQRSMDRDYQRLKHAETRYRLLFQLSDEAVLIVDQPNQRVVEANPAAGHLFGVEMARLVGRPVLDLFDLSALPALRDAIVGARVARRVDPVEVRILDGSSVRLSASEFRQETSAHVLLRLTPPGLAQRTGPSHLGRVLQRLPDGIVLTAPDQSVLEVNTAFLELAEVSTPEQVRGEALERWLGRPGVDMPVLIANLREHGAVRGFATVLRGSYGGAEEVDVTAVAALDAETPCLGFVLRRLSRRTVTPMRNGESNGLPRTADQLTELIGRMPLKEIVSETTDAIERMCIETALKLTRDNRASAAQMLGLSRQSLYAKLKRYDIGSPDDDDES